jgi:hypothetical protein
MITIKFFKFAKFTGRMIYQQNWKTWMYLAIQTKRNQRGNNNANKLWIKYHLFIDTQSIGRAQVTRSSGIDAMTKRNNLNQAIIIIDL